MRRIAVVGAGQAGLQLALTLQAQGYPITLISDRRPEDIKHGNVMSTQCMFEDALKHEREAGVDFWNAECPAIGGAALQVAGPAGQPVIAWHAPLEQPAYAVDQRIKLPRWMELFTERGGTLLFRSVDVDALEQLSQEHDLVLVSAGKGVINQLFTRNPEHSPYDAPQRALALISVHGYEAKQPYEMIEFTILPEVGEYIVIPGMTNSGPCHYLLFEGLPGGPLDNWQTVDSVEAHMAHHLKLIEQWLPWERDRYQHVRPTDAKATLQGRFAPTVRQPVASLPSGRQVFGLGDTLVLNDPITGQGSNNAAKSAAIYAEAIINHGNQPFDADWMQATFNRFWQYASYVTAWTNGMLAPPPPHLVEVLGAAGQAPILAQRFINGFNHPPSFFPWLVDPIAAHEAILEAMSTQAA